jgi:hypothetical protein
MRRELFTASRALYSIEACCNVIILLDLIHLSHFNGFYFINQHPNYGRAIANLGALSGLHPCKRVLNFFVKDQRTAIYATVTPSQEMDERSPPKKLSLTWLSSNKKAD